MLAGRIIAGPLVRLACERHQKDREREAAGGPWVFDADAADGAIEFFERYLRLPDTQDEHGDPRPFLLSPFQKFKTGSLFGWKDRAGYRRFRDAYIEEGKGSGKSPWAAGVGLYGLVMDGERAAEIYAAAVTEKQAKILWTDAYRIVECSPDLAPIIDRSVSNLAYKPLYSFFRPVSSEHRSLDGPRPHMGLIDEIHEHRTPQVVTKIRAGAKGRKQALFIEITNSGYDKASICWEHHEHSRRVLEGTVEDDRWFAFVAGLDEGEDPLNAEPDTDVNGTLVPACWCKANPNLGVSIQPEYLIRQVQTAKNIPAEANNILRLNFCVWTQAEKRFFDPLQWGACSATVPESELIGVPCYAGLDLGQSDDFSAFVLVWALPDGRVAVKPRFWLPRDTLASEKFRDRPYSQWQRAGLLEVTQGNTTDLDVIEDAVLADCERYGVRELAYDKRFAEQLALHLQGAGVSIWNTPQGFMLTEPIKRLSELVASQRLCHGGNIVLAWMADNFVVRPGPNGQMRPDKDSAADKIDGIVGLVMALSRLIVAPQNLDSVYETRGVLVL